MKRVCLMSMRLISIIVAISLAFGPQRSMAIHDSEKEHVVFARGFNFITGVAVANDQSVWITDSGLPGLEEAKARD